MSSQKSSEATVTREVLFGEDVVRNWCRRNDVWNQQHLNEDESPFGEQTVPPMLMLNKVSGLVTQLGEVIGADQLTIGGITAARFRDPAIVGETAEISVVKADEDNSYAYAEFQIESVERGSLVAHGTISFVYD